MKPFFTTLFGVICVAILIIGNIHWGNKTTIEGGNAKRAASVQSSEEQKSETAEADVLDEEEIADILSYAEQWPEGARKSFETALKNGKPFKILFAGSDALGEGEASWPELVEKNLVDWYGEDVFSFSTKIYDLTSTEFLEEGKENELAEEKADLILFEPFTLKDNGKVVIETSWENTIAVIDAVKAVKADTTFVLQPPHPIYDATWYQFQVENLEIFADDNGIPYLDHWEDGDWPDITSAEIDNYLTPEQDGPNEKGHEVWAKYLENFFISRK